MRNKKIEQKFNTLMPERRAHSKKLQAKVNESLASVLPITLVVLVISIVLTPVDIGTMAMFLVGAVMLILGMGLFTMGADMAMLPMGEMMGAQLTRTKKLWLMVVVALIMGILITVAEPDLTVLANQVAAVPSIVIIMTVAIGVGIFLVVGLLRIVFKKKLSHLLLGLYGLVFVFGAFISKDFLPMAFDSGGVTTGPMTVPFILALGVGVSNVRSSKGAQDDSFGLVALCSVGPILAMMVISLLYPNISGGVAETVIENPANTHVLLQLYAQGLPQYLMDVALALSPIIVMFFIFQVTMLKLPASQIKRLAIGLIYTYLGLVLFLAGVNIGFLPMGNYIGHQLALTDYKFILVPLGMVMGYLVVKAEPAVHVLNDQVENVTSGAISKKVMLNTLSIGVAASVGLSMLRVLTGISIWWYLIPGYIIALGLMFFVDPIFTAIAFDSGGVASGPMTAAFMLPFAMGACQAVGGNILQDAFGIVAMVAMTPLIAIQVLGLVYRIKTRNKKPDAILQPVDDEIIEV